MDKLKAKFQKENHFSLEFTQLLHSDIFNSVDTLSGYLYAGNNGRFRLVTDNQTLVSNGVILWNYSIENEQVLIDSVSRIGGWNPLTLIYDPHGVYNCNNEKQIEKNLIFEMSAIDSLTEPRDFNLLIESFDLIPSKIDYYDENDSHIEIFINNFQVKEILSDSLFIFKIPSDIEIIEMP